MFRTYHVKKQPPAWDWVGEWFEFGYREMRVYLGRHARAEVVYEKSRGKRWFE